MYRTFSLKTLGCKLNQHESALLRDSLLRAGWVARPFGEKVDAAIVNTCTVTDRGDKKSRAFIRQGARCAGSGRAVVTGCLVDRDREGVERMPEVLAVFGNREKDLIAGRLARLAGGGAGAGSAPTADAGEIFHRTGGLLKIQDGCDGSCSYCVVPEVRGQPRSEPANLILRRAEALVRTGCPELILTGITIGRYRDDKTDLAALARSILDLPGHFRLRLTSVEPTLVTEALLELLGHEKFCPHLHLPLQSGSDRILELMRRPYCMADYFRLVDRVRERAPRAAIGTDLMVGFPGESDADFAATLEAVHRVGFAYLHQFTFSSRPGTPLAGAGPRLPPAVLADRVKALRELGQQSALGYAGHFVGEKIECVIERDGKGDAFIAVGGNYLKIGLPDSRLNCEKEGMLAEVELLEVDRRAIAGRLAAPPVVPA